MSISGIDVVSENIIRVTKSQTLPVNAEQTLVLADATIGNLTLTLPYGAVINPVQFTILKTDSSSNTVTIQSQSNETINGNSSFTISNQYAKYTVGSDISATWKLLNTQWNDMNGAPFVTISANAPTNGDNYPATTTGINNAISNRAV
jgi:hypothetical protein